MVEAINDASWWAYMSMVLRLGRAIDLLEHWFEACPCHYKQFTEDAPLSGNAIFRTRYKCPMAGRRSPELAAGAVDVLVKDVFENQHMLLVAACSNLSPQDSDKVMMDFGRGQAKLQNFFLMKFAFWQTPPHLLCVLGHHEEAEARAGLEKAQELFNMQPDSDSHHPLTLHFFRGPLMEHLNRFLSHEIRREDSFELMRESACAFIPCVERSIEARHALLKAKTAVMKKIRPATFSLAVRSHEFHRRCLRNKELLLDWEKHVKSLKSVPKQGLPVLVRRIGFAAHSNVLRLQRLGAKVKLRDVAYMVYRCDIETMYDRRVAAGQTMHKPHFRDNPDAAGKLRKLVASQETSEDKQSLMLRILMMEHVSQRCQESEIYCIQGPLPEPRYLKDSLIPGGDVRKGSPDKVEPLVPDLVQAQQPAAQSDDDQPRQFVQARRSASVACGDRIHCFKFF